MQEFNYVYQFWGRLFRANMFRVLIRRFREQPYEWTIFIVG